MISCTEIRFYGYLACITVFSLSFCQPALARMPGTAQTPSFLVGLAEHDEQRTKKDPDDKRKKEKEEEKKEEEKKKEGKLGEFEKEATGEEAEEEDESDENDLDSCIEFVDTVIEVIEVLDALGVFEVIDRGTEWSWARVHRRNDPSFPDEMKRMPGEPVLPFANIEIGYQNVEDDVEAVDVRTELGYGDLALQFRETYYEEKAPFDRLNLIQWHILIRMSFPRFVEVDLGLGSNIIHGDDTNSGFSLTVPIRIQPHRWVCVQLRPNLSSINDNSIADFDLGISVGPRYVNFRAGYRWVTSGRASLNGPFFGAALHF